MAFKQASASVGARNNGVLSADNSIPERHIVLETLRKAAPLLGVKPAVLSTLDTLISCLPPKRSHHTVFASNATLVFRRNGISERTIRRHVTVLQDCGLLERRDSPNRKRYTRHNKQDGVALRFGFDLTPLYDRMHELAAMATAVTQAQERCAYLKAKTRSAAHDILATDPYNTIATQILRQLRRKMDVTECEALLDIALEALSQMTVNAEGAADMINGCTGETSGTNGQNVRHHHNSNKELIDKKSNETETPINTETDAITLNELLTACPNAAEFAMRPIQTIADVVSHAKTLAPMIGINDHNYSAAQRRLGPVGAAVTVWALLQIHDRIRQVGAYFRSITTGRHKDQFDPFRFIKRLRLAPHTCDGPGQLSADNFGF